MFIDFAADLYCHCSVHLVWTKTVSSFPFLVSEDAFSSTLFFGTFLKHLFCLQEIRVADSFRLFSTISTSKLDASCIIEGLPSSFFPLSFSLLICLYWWCLVHGSIGGT